MATEIIGMESEKHVDELLFYAVKKRDWKEVVKILKDYPDIRAAKISRNSDTALHAAIINDAPESTVGKMVDLIEDIDRMVDAMEDTDTDTDTHTQTHTLSAENNRKDTSLHCAATRGSVYICQRIVEVDQSLIERRNKEGETPLFLAALNGRKEVFFYLHNICKDIRVSSNVWRRNNGDTILHCTIQNMFFDLAFQIMHLYEGIAAARNVKGETPLHILASTPSAFPSGTRLELWEKLCYKFIQVEKLRIIEPPEAYKTVDVVEPSTTDQTHAPVESYWNILVSLRRKIERHVWGRQIMENLVKLDYRYDYIQVQTELQQEIKNDIDKLKSTSSPDESQNNIQRDTWILTAIKYGVIEMAKILKGKPDKDLYELKKLVDDDIDMLMQKNTRGVLSTPLLTAVKYGLTELVDKILEENPEALYDTNSADNKNIVLVAVEERQSTILAKVMKHRLWKEELKYAVDTDGNNALHLAAKFSERTTWELPMSAMHMQWEVMWYEWVKEMMPHHFSYAKNYKEEETPSMIFSAEHKGLAEDSNQWLKDSSGSYTVASTIITSITFSTSYQILGGSKDDGSAKLIGNLAFDAFAMATLFAFTFSITALAAFLAIYGSQKQPKEYRWRIPMTLLIGLASLFVSMFATLVSFYAGHSLEVDRRKFHKVLPLYAFTLVPACFYIATQIPLFVDVFRAIISRVPHSASIVEEKDVPS